MKVHQAKEIDPNKWLYRGIILKQKINALSHGRSRWIYHLEENRIRINCTSTSKKMAMRTIDKHLDHIEHGGHREGAGRPRIDPDDKKVALVLYIKKSVFDKIKAADAVKAMAEVVEEKATNYL